MKYKILKIPTPIKYILNIIGTAWENKPFSKSNLGIKHWMYKYLRNLHELILYAK